MAPVDTFNRCCQSTQTSLPSVFQIVLSTRNVLDDTLRNLSYQLKQALQACRQARGRY